MPRPSTKFTPYQVISTKRKPSTEQSASAKSLNFFAYFRCTTTTYPKKVISAQVSLGSHPQNRPQDSLAQTPPSTVPIPRVINPICKQWVIILADKVCASEDNFL